MGNASHTTTITNQRPNGAILVIDYAVVNQTMSQSFSTSLVLITESQTVTSQAGSPTPSLTASHNSLSVYSQPDQSPSLPSPSAVSADDLSGSASSKSDRTAEIGGGVVVDVVILVLTIL